MSVERRALSSAKQPSRCVWSRALLLLGREPCSSAGLQLLPAGAGQSLHLAAARRLRVGNLQMRAPRLRMRGPANSEGRASGRGGAQRGRQAAKAQPGPSWVAQQRTGVERRRWPPRDALLFTSTLLAAAPSDVLEPGG